MMSKNNLHEFFDCLAFIEGRTMTHLLLCPIENTDISFQVPIDDILNKEIIMEQVPNKHKGVNLVLPLEYAKLIHPQPYAENIRAKLLKAGTARLLAAQHRGYSSETLDFLADKIKKAAIAGELNLFFDGILLEAEKQKLESFGFQVVAENNQWNIKWL